MARIRHYHGTKALLILCYRVDLWYLLLSTFYLMFPSNVCLLLLLANSDFFFFISPCSLLPVNISSCALLHFTIRSCFQLHFVIYNLLPGYYFSCYLNLSLFEATFSAQCGLKEHPSFSQITRPPKGGLLLIHQLHICHIRQTYSNILMVNLINLPWTYILWRARLTLS